jgi:hypothetical protein
MRALLAVAALLVFPAAAPAKLFLNADATSHRGFITVTAVASPDLTQLALGERAGDAIERLGTFALRPAPELADTFGPAGIARLPDLLPWRCERTRRRLVAAASGPDYHFETATFSVRTPSCRNRLVLEAPLRVRPGRRFTVRVRDTWETGGVTARVCVRARCHDVALTGPEATLGAHIGRRGHWPLTLRAPGQSLDREVAVGVAPRPDAAALGTTVLVTGDSMMQSVDAVLQDRLARRATTVSAVRVGAGLTKTAPVVWSDFARQSVRESHPHATIIMIGASDAYAIDGVECCGDEWTAAYQRRVGDVMSIYAQHGAGRVLWLTVPYARDPRFHPFQRAVNRAVRRAAHGRVDADVLRTDRIFTPGGRYRATMTVDGRRVRVREEDGIHLTIPGARIVAVEISRRLRALKLI